jgi:hypothetical protein
MPLNCFAIVPIQRNERRKEAGLFAEGLELERRRVVEEALPGRVQQAQGAKRRRLAEVRANNVMHV